jgi:hypothetical protein
MAFFFPPDARYHESEISKRDCQRNVSEELTPILNKNQLYNLRHRQCSKNLHKLVSNYWREERQKKGEGERERHFFIRKT